MQSVLLGVSLALLSVTWWPTPYALAADTKVARGTVVAIGGSSLIVNVRNQDMTFSIDPKTIVEARGAGTKSRAAEANGKAGPKLADVLTVGQTVAVTYHEIDGVLHAAVVRTVPSAAAGGDGAATEPAPMMSTGTVQAIGANSITIAGGGGGGAVFTQTFVIDERTKVFAKGAGTAAAANGGRVPFGDIVKSGDHVSVSYHKVGSQLHASDVRVTMKAMH